MELLKTVFSKSNKIKLTVSDILETNDTKTRYYNMLDTRIKEIKDNKNVVQFEEEEFFKTFA